MKTIVKLGFAALAAGAFFTSTAPVIADQYASESSNYFTKHGLPVPGAYFKARESQQAATIAVSKSGKGVGEQKQTTSKVAKKHTKQVQSANSGS
jgi:hypothetical protein